MTSDRTSLDDTVVLRPPPSARTAAAGAPTGIAFAADPQGRRSSLAAGKQAFAAAASVLSAPAARAILEEPDWRRRYPAHVRAMLEQIITHPQLAVDSARKGLDALYRSIEFYRDGTSMPLEIALRAPTPDRLHTVTIAGEGREPPSLAVPYRGEQLTGERLNGQLDRWVEKGICEPSFAMAIEAVMGNPDWLDLADWNIAALGAGAELGPFGTLASWRANLIAVDVPNPDTWRRIIAIARRGNGRVRIPVSEGSSADDPRLPDLAGANLLTSTPQIRNWLASMPEPLALGCFAYLDGEAHVRVSVAMDAIVADLIALRRTVAPAYLLTPTDCYAVPLRALEQSLTRFRTRGVHRLWQEPLRWASRNRLFVPNVERFIDAPDGFRTGIVDALVVEQGPNYALAKRLQQWRALAVHADGNRVSVNVAPAARTHSVIKNPALKAAYKGARLFDVEVFDPDTANVLMAALFVHDLRTSSGSSAPDAVLAHPLQLFMEGALHSGLWTVPFAPRSALPVAALLGYL